MCLYLVRHASAGKRGDGFENDLERPLDAHGREQADHIAGLLADVGVTSIYSSMAVRCTETMMPLGIKLGLDVVEHPALMEGQCATAAVKLLRDFAVAGETAALCSHGDVIPDSIQILAREGMVVLGQRAWSKGSTWRLDTRGTDIVSATFLDPF